MKARYLLTIVGTVLPDAASRLLPTNGADHYAERINVVPIENQSIDHSNVAQQQPHLQPRLLLQLNLQDDTGEEPVTRSDVAYVALLMDDHDRGIRTLGQSLIDTRTTADLVAILGAGVKKDTEDRVRSQGWRIRRLAPVDDVGSRLGGDRKGAFDMDSPADLVLAHASTWSLTEYKRVVLLADNMLVVDNIDDLFQCPGVCAVMQQGEIMSTSLVVLQPDPEVHAHMSQAVGNTYSFSQDFQGFLNSYLAGFESCALFDLENTSLQDPSTDPHRGPDAQLLDHSCHRLPTRYNGDLLLVMLNGGLGMVRTKNPMPDAWWEQRRARVVRFDFAGLRPWMWFASPFMPFVSIWESTYLRTTPGEPTPSIFWRMLLWLLVVLASLGVRALLAPMALRRLPRKGGVSSSAKAVGGWRGCLLRLWEWSRRRRGGMAGSYNPRGVLWSALHVAAGYSFLSCAVVLGVGQVPAACSIKLSWFIFIIWTGTIFGMLWSLYLWLLCFCCALDLGSVSGEAVLSTPPREVMDPFRPKLMEGGVLRVGGEVPLSPMRESLTSLALFVAALAVLPMWKPLSGAASLPALLGPAALVLIATVLGLTVQMVRLPVLWCDHLQFLAMMEKEGMLPCGHCGRIQ